MKIGIYNEPCGTALGGSEQCTAVLAEALQDAHTVEIVHHREDLTRDALAAFCGVNLHRVKMRFVPSEPLPPPTSNPGRRWQAQTAWNAKLSAPYDVFVAITHSVPPFCRARRGILVVLFPFYDRRKDEGRRHGLRGHIEQWFSNRLWQKRMAGYGDRLAISEFTRHWTRQRWETDCPVLPPPVDTDFLLAGVEKKNQIISIGRFATLGHTKKQREMVDAFASLHSAGPMSGWEYVCAGGVSTRADERALFDSVHAAAQGQPVRLLPNISRADLKAQLQQSMIFWHAAGYGQSEAQPERMEHFGITTVEAMAAGCVPVVISRGGQPEIVEHGVSGFLWNTWDELTEYTLCLAFDPERRQRMADAARARADYFSRARFAERFQELLRQP